MKYIHLYSKYSTLVIVILGLSLLVINISSNRTEAVSGGDFNPSRIIDDAVFYNSNSMSVTQIQQFLNSKVPTCDTNGTTGPYYDRNGNRWTSRAAYGTASGSPPPYTCLKDYSQPVASVTNGGSDLCKNSIAGGTKSAAQIILDAAQACGINPQVLIVMLQKEQSLITDEWPWPIQYNTAMGYACPDSGPNNSANCNSTFFGFFTQVYDAAKAYRRYELNPTSYNYRAGRNNFVLYNPNTACGGTNIFIQNQATANLYIYTPYQPNQAALNNLYGTGDGCSAYGNRNFWRMFNDWFGSTFAPNYAWSLVSQSVFTDDTMTVSTGTAELAPESRIYASIKIKNTGNQTWTNTGSNPVRFGTVRPLERVSSFCDSTWLSCSRPTNMLEASVAPGATATFNFWMKAPLAGIQTSEYFAPVVEGLLWMQDIGLFYSMTSQSAQYTWQMTSQYAYTDQTKTVVKNMANLIPGERVYVGFKAKNTGNMMWSNTGPNAILTGTISPQERPSAFSPGSNWLSGTRPTLLQESNVAPGQTGTFEFWMTAPSVAGVRHERFGLIANNYSWLNDTGLSFYTETLSQKYTWQMTSQYAYTDQTKTVVKNMANLIPGERVYVGFKAKNTGNMMWSNTGPNAILTGTISPQERPSAFSPGSNWLSGTRPTLLQESNVAPGQTGTFEFWMTAPSVAGVRHERFGLIANNYSWLNDTGLSFYTEVN